ncbi:hypothetical protein [Luteimonas sp. R10]|uniref:hypothetical protein n=1 Tax=Luteimonas sp. R10 TaxID=3108176 RepID=UPI0030901EDB|nr:hypothetical protein U3649_07170 [Luteimonas sp. R10]
MRTLRLLSVAALLACAASVAAQQPPLEQQMTHQEFVDAGLNKLSPQELAALNAWLQRRPGAGDAAAVEQAREEGRREAAERRGGFLGNRDSEPVESTLTGEFRGFGKGNRYTLANGQVWEQTDAASLAGVRATDPKVTVRPGMLGAWWLQIDGYNTRAKVRRIE